ncbi:MAG: transposase [Ktedonobacteraceae bacterium]|nr:transposase [Ktedonobacteraceae bacterium]
MEITEEMVAAFRRPKGFRHLPRRWVVEHTLAWIGNNRRMSKGYEYLPSSSESMVQLTMIRPMLKRLAGQLIARGRRPNGFAPPEKPFRSRSS